MSFNKKILMVDDDTTYVFLTKKIIERIGLPVKIQVSGDGQQAVDFLKYHLEDADALPDVIFLDLNMPVLDGWGFLNAYVTLAPQLKKKILIYIVSSSISPKDIERALQLDSVIDFLIKPLARKKIIEIVNCHAIE